MSVLRLTNSIRSGGDKCRLRGSLRLGHFIPTPPFTYIGFASVTLTQRRILRTLSASLAFVQKIKIDNIHCLIYNKF